MVRARYEAELARRRYRAVEPDNRLVGSELERQWEAALMALREAEEAAARFAERPAEPELAPEAREQLTHLSQTLPAPVGRRGIVQREPQAALAQSHRRGDPQAYSARPGAGEDCLGERSVLGRRGDSAHP